MVVWHNSLMQQNRSVRKRGRPVVNAQWPSTKFTFKNLLSSNSGVLCASSLRNKIKLATKTGDLTVVDKVPNNMGRPELVYQRQAEAQPAYHIDHATSPSCNTETTEESAGENTPSS